jgi:hypothetical protein
MGPFGPHQAHSMGPVGPCRQDPAGLTLDLMLRHLGGDPYLGIYPLTVTALRARPDPRKAPQ